MNCHAARVNPAELDALRCNADLVGLVGAHVELKRQGREFIGRCPFHAEATPSFSVVPDKHFYHCFGCGKHGDAITWLQEVEGLSFIQAIEKLRGNTVMPQAGFKPACAKERQEKDQADVQKKIIAARKIWDEAHPAIGTIVERYLASRGLQGVVPPPTLRFHPAVWNAETNSLLPAMIGCVIRRNQIVGVHRTYLLPDGSGKAMVRVSKKMLGACHGGHVRLDNCGVRLAVAEGIETALSVKKACPWVPVWAALSLTNMDAEVPKSVKELILCADGDNKDPKTADAYLNKAAAFHAAQGRTVRIARPPVGKDFNDVVRG